ncbi:hypothetical protein T492DRAFT_1132647 [Pavlovales sp. CCMP2436]|nr:hypothetical protein T492DRAFT_1132647 [Pavlovales sp. CCMP2436]
MSMAPQERRGSMAPPPADSDARRVSMAPQERRGSTASRSDSNPTARRDPGARRPSDAGTLRRGSLGGPPPPPKRSAENDRILELKQIADRAAGKRDEDEERPGPPPTPQQTISMKTTEVDINIVGH